MDRRSRAQRIIPYVILLVSLVSGLVLVWPFRAFVDDRLAALRQSVVAGVERATGLRVRYDHLSPSLLLQAEVVGLRLERHDGTPVFTARRVRIAYSLFDFLGPDPVAALRGIELEGGVIDLDFKIDAKLLGLDAAPAAADVDVPEQVRAVFDRLAASLPTGVAFRLRDSALNLRDGGSAFGLRIGAAELLAEGERLGLRVSVDVDSELHYAGVLDGRVAGTIDVEAQYFRAGRQLRLQAGTRQFVTPWGRLEPQSLALSLVGEELRLNRITDNEPLDVQGRWFVRQGRIEAVVKSRAFRLGTQFTPAASFEGWPRVVYDAAYDVDLSLGFDLTSKALSYGGSVKARGRWKETDDVRVSATLKSAGAGLPQGEVSVELPGLRAVVATVPGSTGEELAAEVDFEVGEPWLPERVAWTGPLRLRLTEAGFAVRSPGGNLWLGDYGAELSGVKLDWAGGAMGFDLVAVPAAPGADSAPVTLKGVYRFGEVDLEAPVDRFRFQDAAGLIRPLGKLVANYDVGAIDWSFVPADVRASGLLTVSSHGSLDLRVAGLEIYSDAVHGSGGLPLLLRGDLRCDGQRFTLEEADPAPGASAAGARLYLPGLELGCSAWLSLEPEGALAAGLVVSSRDLGPFRFTGFRSADGNFSVQGPYDLFVTGRETAKGIELAGSFAGLRVPPLGRQAALSGSGGAVIGWDGSLSGRVQRLDLVSVELNPLIPRLVGRLTLTDGTVGASGAEFAAFRYQDAVSVLSGPLKLGWKATDLPHFTWEADLRGQPGFGAPLVLTAAERLTSSGSWQAAGLAGTVEWSGAPLSRFLEDTVKGAFDLKLDFALDPADPWPGLKLAGTLDGNRLFVNRDPLSVTVGFMLEDRRLLVGDGRLGFLEHRLALSDLELDFHGGTLQADADYRRSDQPGAVPVRLRAEASWPGDAATIQDILFRAFEGKLTARNVPGFDRKSYDYQVGFIGAKDSLAFEELGAGMARGSIGADGTFRAVTRTPFPFASSISGQIRGSQIEANVSNLDVSLSSFPGLVDLGMFRLDAGHLTGSLRLVGDLNDPEIYGSLRGDGLKAAFSMVPDLLLAERGVLVFEERTVRLLPLAVRAGAASARAEAEFYLRRLNVGGVSIKVNIPSESPPVRVKGRFAMIEAEGGARGRLAVDWAGNLLKVDGQIQAEEGSVLYAPPTGEAPPPDDGEEPFNYAVKLGISSGKGIEFLYPNRSVPILKTQFDPGQSLDFAYDSAAGTWSLRGDLKARGGQIIFVKRNFMLRSTVISFNENDKGDFNPRISARAETRLMYQDKPLKVAIVLEDSPFATMQPRFESDPALPSGDLLALVAGAPLAGDPSATANGAVDLLSAAGGFGVQLVFADPINSVRDFLGLDLLSFRTDVFTDLFASNFASAIGLSGKSSPLDNQSQSLGELLSVQFGKFFGDDLFLSVTGRLSQRTATGALDTSSATALWGSIGKASGLSADFELSMDWALPFADLNWSWAPKDVTSVERILKDNTFTLSWRLQ